MRSMRSSEVVGGSDEVMVCEGFSFNFFLI